MNRFWRRMGLAASVFYALASFGYVPSLTAGEATIELKQALQDSGIFDGQKPASGELIPVVIYHTNDIHGEIGPSPAQPKYKAPASGGAASLATLLGLEKDDYLYLDSGDWFQGTPVGNLTRGESVIAVLNKLKADASVLGNHEFDYGEENIKKLVDMAEFDVLGTNIISEVTGKVVDYAEPYVIKRLRNGITVGILGVLTPNTAELTFPENVKGVRFTNSVAAAKRAVEKLALEGADIIIALSHLGIEEYNGIKYGGTEGDLLLAKEVPEIDLILGGHTHTHIEKPIVVKSDDGKTTIIAQTRGKLGSVNRLVLKVDPIAKRVVGFEGGPIFLDPAKYSPDPEMQALVAEYMDRIKQRMNKIIGFSTVEMTRDSSDGQSLIGNWVTDAFRRHGKTDVAVINAGGIRGGLPKGQVTYRDVYKVAPFDNSLVKLEIRGSELWKFVEGSLSKDQVYCQYSGLQIEYDPAQPRGTMLTSLKVGGVPIQENQIYTVATTDYVALVGKYYFKQVENNLIEKCPILARDLLLEEVRKRSPISSQIDERIRVKTTPARAWLNPLFIPEHTLPPQYAWALGK